MKKIIALFLLFSFHQSVFSQGYKNPVIPGFYPDPSVCRVGNDFYLVNSSFEYFPGIPIWHSKDLINWEQIGNVLDRPSQLPLKNAKPSNGIYAPTIRYHDGVFYMVVTLVSGTMGYGNFYVTATNPAGPWSEPIHVAQSGIDPSLFWDDDGKTYFISNRATKSTDPRAIYQSEIDIKKGKLLSEIKMLWKGSGGSYVEGPHMYKKDGYYYLLTAEGGTAYGHTVAIGRSKNIWGPFESCPHNPILTNRMAYNIIQGTGHADIVQAADSSWWMVHLAFRPAVDGIHFIGRETCLTPVEWKKDDWPIVNKLGQTDEVMKVPTLPLYPFTKKNQRDDFNQDKMDFSWIHLRNPEINNYSLTERKDYLRLKGSAYTLNDLESPTFVGRRQQHFNFTATTQIDFNPNESNEEAGLTLLMTNEHHYDFFIKKSGSQRFLIVKYKLELLQNTIAEIPLEAGEVHLRISGDKKLYYFSYSQGNKPFTEIAKINTKFLGTEVTGGYNGVIIGMYATGNGKSSTSNSDFDWFEYSGKD